VRLTCVFARPGPRCVQGLATPDRMPDACEACDGYSGPSRGLGDVVAKVAQATGVAAVVKRVAGDGCGCSGRRAALNRAMPFREGAD